MATVKEVIATSKEDGTWNVKIGVYHNAKSSYIETQHFANQKQVRRDLTIKDPIILKMINPVIGSYRTTISKLGAKLSLYNAKNSLIIWLLASSIWKFGFIDKGITQFCIKTNPK